MNFEEVMKQLESFGSEQTRKTYARHGINGAMFGVSYANLGALKKKIKTDHNLARELWATGNHEARVLATMIADPAQMSSKDLDAWAKELSDMGITDAFAKLAAQTPLAQKKFEKWCEAKDEWTATAGWMMVGQAVANQALPDAYFEPYLETIERDIHSQKNRVRYSMNSALIAIGMRGGALQKKALAVAKKIGKVEVDHGDTNCKTPDAAEYILKAAAHRDKQRAKAQAK